MTFVETDYCLHQLDFKLEISMIRIKNFFGYKRLPAYNVGPAHHVWCQNIPKQQIYLVFLGILSNCSNLILKIPIKLNYGKINKNPTLDFAYFANLT